MLSRWRFVTLLLLIPTRPCSADESRYFVVPQSESPKGTYVLAFSVKGRSKVDWTKLRYDSEYEDYRLKVLGDDEENVECHLFRKRNMTPVKRVTNIPYWPAYHRLGPPQITWRADESAFLDYMHGYWSIDYCDLTMTRRSKAGHVNLLPIIERGLKRYRRQHPGVFRRKHGLVYGYMFDPTHVVFMARNRVRLKLNLFVPKAASDWKADVLMDLRLSPATRSLRATVTRIKLVSLHPETPED